MEVLSKSSEGLDVFLGGDEYHALLRPDGMLSLLAAEHPESASTVKTARHHHGAVMHIPATVAPAVMAGTGTLLIDDLLRRTIARWYASLEAPRGVGAAT